MKTTINKQTRVIKAKRTASEFVIVVPALAFYLIFVIYPLLGGIFYSLTDWDGVSASFNMIGIQNYINLLKDKYVLEPLVNTFVYAFFTTIILNVLGLAMAVGAERVAHGRNVFRALLFIPAVLSSVVVGYIFNFIFANVFGEIGKMLDIRVLANNILGSTKY